MRQRRKKRLWGVLIIITALIIMQLPVSEADAASASDFRMEGNTLLRYRGTEETVSVPDGVVVIGEGAFEDNPYVELVVLPDSVQRIDPYAFWGCDNLDTVVLGTGLSEIGDFAFAGCHGLEQMTLPTNITSIGMQAFGDCFNMTIISIPNQTVSIHERAFDGCYRLKIQCNPGSIADQYAQAFYERQQEMPEYEDVPGYNDDATMPETTPEPTPAPDYYSVVGSTYVVGNSAYFFVDGDLHVYEGKPQTEAETLPLADFQNIDTLNGIPKYTIVDGIIVADQAYYRSNTLGNVALPDGIAEVGEFAFARSSISAVVIPEGATKIGYGAFYHCDYLEKVSIPETVRCVEPKAFTHTGWVDKFLQGTDGTQGDFLISGGVLVAYRGTAKDVVIPDGVRVIAGEVFRNNTEIETLTLPEGLLIIGEGAFEGCKYLMQFTIPESLEEVKDRAFYGTGIAKGTVTLPKTLQKLGVQAFGNAELKFRGQQPEYTYETSATRLSNYSYRGETDEIQTTAGVVVNGLSGAVATLEGADRSYTLTLGLAKDISAMEEGCYRTFKADIPEDMVVYEIVLTDASGIPLKKLGHQSLTVAIPVPDSLQDQNLKLLTLDRNGQPEALAVERVTMDGVDCFLFMTNNISMFGVYGTGEVVAEEDVMVLSVEMNSMSAAPRGSIEAESEIAVGVPLWKRVNVLVGIAMLLTGVIIFLSGGKRKVVRK